MERNGDFDLDAPVHKFCLSWFALRVSHVGTTLFVRSWNEHSIPGSLKSIMCRCYLSHTALASLLGKGIPNRLARIKHTGAVPPSMVMSPEDAVQAFEGMGGNLTLFSPFGVDPIADRADLVAARESEFFQRVPDFTTIFHSLVNGNDHPFRDGFKFFLELTQRLTPP